jgi:hypothetical protein
MGHHSRTVSRCGDLYQGAPSGVPDQGNMKAALAAAGLAN